MDVRLLETNLAAPVLADACPEVFASSFSGPVSFIYSFTHLQTQLVFVKQLLCVSVGFPGGASGKEPSCQCRRHKIGKLDPWEDPLEEEMATHSSILTCRIPWTEEPGGLLQSIGSQRDMTGVTWHTHTHGAAKEKECRLSEDRNLAFWYVLVSSEFRIIPDTE